MENLIKALIDLANVNVSVYECALTGLIDKEIIGLFRELCFKNNLMLAKLLYKKYTTLLLDEIYKNDQKLLDDLIIKGNLLIVEWMCDIIDGENECVNIAKDTLRLLVSWESFNTLHWLMDKKYIETADFNTIINECIKRDSRRIMELASNHGHKIKIDTIGNDVLIGTDTKAFIEKLNKKTDDLKESEVPKVTGPKQDDSIKDLLKDITEKLKCVMEKK